MGLTHTHTRFHTEQVSQGGRHAETSIPVHTDQNNVFVRRELFHGTHTRHTEASEASLYALVPDRPIISLHLTVLPLSFLCVTHFHSTFVVFPL